eukprot:jgi/Hompol1/6220/HPOL_004889-RA
MEIMSALEQCTDRRKIDILPTQLPSTEDLDAVQFHHHTRLATGDSQTQDQDHEQMSIVESQYEIVWVHPESFHCILISQFMGLDHLPNRLGDTLRSLVCHSHQ